jgi:hypothetical protein
MTTTTTFNWEWNNSIDKYAFPLEDPIYSIDDDGIIYDSADRWNPVGFVEKLPQVVKVITLDWAITHEQRQEVVTCRKLTGSNQKIATPNRRKESPDGMRGGASQWGEVSGPKAHFVPDEYQVTVTYTATKAVNQFGEIVEGKPKFPSATTIAYETGYGKVTEYFVTDLAVLDLPTEKTEKVFTSQKSHFYKAGNRFVEGLKTAMKSR